MNLFEQQRANRRRTWVVMIVFVLFLGFIGAGVDLFMLNAGGYAAPFATLIALGVGVISAWGTYLNGDRAVLKSASAVPVDMLLAGRVGAISAENGATLPATDDDRLRYQQFKNIVEEMAIAAGVPAPAAYVIPDDDPNAFATGRDPEHASIAVTAGLLRTLNREELQGVVAHELGHVRNFDIRLMMIVAALVGGSVLLADFAGRMMWYGGGRRIGGGGRRDKNLGPIMVVVFVLWVLAIILAPIITQLMALAVSRSREYQADASGAELTRNPNGLVSALRKIEDADAPTKSIKRGTANLCIADPLGRQVNERESRWSSLFATHPPMAKRIAALEEMAFKGTR